MNRKFPFTQKEFYAWAEAQSTDRKVYEGVGDANMHAMNCCPLAQFLLSALQPAPLEVSVNANMIEAWYVVKNDHTVRRWDTPQWVCELIVRIDRMASVRIGGMMANQLVTFDDIKLSGGVKR